jgi:hypothetical protein
MEMISDVAEDRGMMEASSGRRESNMLAMTEEKPMLWKVINHSTMIKLPSSVSSTSAMSSHR